MRTPTVHHHRKNKNGKSKSLHGGLCSDDALRDKSDTLAGHYDKQWIEGHSGLQIWALLRSNNCILKK